MIRHKRPVEIKKRGVWITVEGIIDEQMLCKHPQCNRKPPGGTYHSGSYCSTKCAQRHKRLLYLANNDKHNKAIKYNKIHIPMEQSIK